MRYKSPCLSKELQLAHLSAVPRRTSDSNYRGSFSTGVGTESEEVPLHFELKMPIKLKFLRWPPMSLSQIGSGASVSITDSAWRGKNSETTDKQECNSLCPNVAAQRLGACSSRFLLVSRQQKKGIHLQKRSIGESVQRLSPDQSDFYASKFKWFKLAAHKATMRCSWCTKESYKAGQQTFRADSITTQFEWQAAPEFN